jgi:hypothetical protein
MRRQTRIRQHDLTNAWRNPLDKLTQAVLERATGPTSFDALKGELPARSADICKTVRRLEAAGRIEVTRSMKRRPGSKMIDQPNRYKATRDEREDNRGIILPAAADFDPGRSASRWILYGIELREQLIAGAVQLPADVAAHLVGGGMTAKAVRDARADWRRRGHLRDVPGKPGVHTLDSSHHKADLDRFEPNRQKKRTIIAHGHQLRLWGTAKQAAALQTLLAQLEEGAAATVVAEITSHGYLIAGDVLEIWPTLTPRETDPDTDAEFEAIFADIEASEEFQRDLAAALATSRTSLREPQPPSRTSLREPEVLESQFLNQRRSAPQETKSSAPRQATPSPLDALDALSGPYERHGFEGETARPSTGEPSPALSPSAPAGPSLDGPTEGVDYVLNS